MPLGKVLFEVELNEGRRFWATGTTKNRLSLTARIIGHDCEDKKCVKKILFKNLRAEQVYKGTAPLGKGRCGETILVGIDVAVRVQSWQFV